MLPLAAYAQQVVYNYDNAGNRLSRSTGSKSSKSRRKEHADEEFINLSQLIYVGPNPTTGLLTIRIPSLTDGSQCSVALYSMSGQVLQESVVTSQETTLDLSSYPNGYYLLTTKLGNEQNSYKVVKY